MATKELAISQVLAQDIERALIDGNLDKLTTEQKLSYYNAVCESIGLNPLTNPFQYLRLNGKVVLYAAKSCTDQLRQIHGVSVLEMVESRVEDVFVVTVKVQNAKGRIDQSKGAVTLGNLKGDALANAIMKCETKAKRRATLSICGLGMLDESEIETIPGASTFDKDAYVKAKTEELAKPIERKEEQTIEEAWREKIKICSEPADFNQALIALVTLPKDFKVKARATLVQRANAVGLAWDKSSLSFYDPKARLDEQLHASVDDLLPANPALEPISKGEEIELHNARRRVGLSIKEWDDIKGRYGVEHTRDLQKANFHAVLQEIKDHAKQEVK